MDESDIDAAIEATRTAVLAAAQRAGFHQAEDAYRGCVRTGPGKC